MTPPEISGAASSGASASSAGNRPAIPVSPPDLVVATKDPASPAATAPATALPGRKIVVRPVAKKPPKKLVDPQWQPNMTPFAPHTFQTEVRMGRSRDGVRVPRIVLAEQAYDKTVHFVDIAPEEVGWLGTVEQLRDGRYLIKDMWLFEQAVHGTTTRIDPDGLAQFMEAHRGTPEGDDIWENTRFWGHSHVNMDVFPSMRDDDQMEEFRTCGQEYFIRGIHNKRGKIKFDFYDFQHGIVFIDVPWEKLDTVDPQMRDEIQEEFDENVHPMGGAFGLLGRRRREPEPVVSIPSMATPAVAPLSVAQAKAEVNPVPAEPEKAKPAEPPPSTEEKTEVLAPSAAPKPTEGAADDCSA